MKDWHRRCFYIIWTGVGALLGAALVVLADWYFGR